MKTNAKTRVTSPQSGSTHANKIEPRYDCIKLGIDWHARQYRVARIIDNAAPEPAQRFKPHEFLLWAKKQLGRAKTVKSCYEAGAGGYVLHRQLVELGVDNMVVTARKLDPNNRGVQTDKTDARDLVMDLDRFSRVSRHCARSTCPRPSKSNCARRAGNASSFRSNGWHWPRKAARCS